VSHDVHRFDRDGRTSSTKALADELPYGHRVGGLSDECGGPGIPARGYADVESRSVGVDHRHDSVKKAPIRDVDRRRSARGTPTGEPSRSDLVTMIEATYREMPGLGVHLNQAARLFGLRDRTCEVVLDDLVRDGRLRRSADGQYRAP
jgi:hypothetical protein